MIESQDKMHKNKNDICSCHDVKRAVFGVQGLYLNMETGQKIAPKC
jgi:hypothetical protein